jgi:ribosomal protein S18 acetylase RimI-like enzyme
VSIASTSATTPYYLPVRQDWLDRRKEPILEPDLPIVDPHHHLWDRPGWRYLLNAARRRGGRMPTRCAGDRASGGRMIRRATEDDVARIDAIAHAAYIKYVPRMGREPPPMLADFAAEIAAGHVVVIEVARAVEGYLISWPKMEAYFIDNIAVDPVHQGLGLGRQLMEYAVREAKRHNLSAIQLYTNATMTENLAMYAHMGFVETHRVMETQFHIETGFPRVYMCRTLA